MKQFPEGFLWGSATSSYQVEGGNVNADWWNWEKQAGKQNSGSACRHYELFREDFDLAKSLNHNAHRISIEWSRIEAKENEFSAQEINHYIEVVKALKERGLEPIVTLHHFTNPDWISKKGGWLNNASVEYFLRFSRYVIEPLAKYVKYWITVNEPTVYAYHSYVTKSWPPQGSSYLKAKKVIDNLSVAHIEAYKLIHEIYQKLGIPKPAVSIAHNMQAFVPCQGKLINKLAANFRNEFYNYYLLNKYAKLATLDFIGVNYYSRQLVDVRSFLPWHFMQDVCSKNHDPVRKNSLGWDIYPKGLYDLLIGLKKYNLPIIITENGICTEDDDLRWEYINTHLKSLNSAISAGVDVKGYLYWSLLDNFEWDKGFSARFGLVEVDYDSCKRNIRESAKRYSEVCRQNALI